MEGPNQARRSQEGEAKAGKDRRWTQDKPRQAKTAPKNSRKIETSLETSSRDMARRTETKAKLQKPLRNHREFMFLNISRERVAQTRKILFGNFAKSSRKSPTSKNPSRECQKGTEERSGQEESSQECPNGAPRKPR